MYCDWPTFQRCCLCMPLRRGVLVIAYIKIIFSAFMLGMYSYAVNQDIQWELPSELCVFIYSIECMFAAFLIYGAHKKLLRLVRAYYYFSIYTLITTLLLQIVQMACVPYFWHIFELAILCFTGLCLQLYLMLLVRSLVKKLEVDGPHVYENQLHQFINNGQAKVEPNGVRNPSTVPVDV